MELAKDAKVLTNDVLYFRRSFAQSKVRMVSEMSKAGNRRVSSSINSEKIADSTRQFLQGSVEMSEFKYDRLIKLANEDLAEDFDRLGFNEPKNATEAKEFEKKKRVAISNWQERYIKEKFPNVLKIDFDTFVKSTNIKTAKRSVGEALKILDKAQNSNFYEIEHMKLDLETGELSTGLSKTAALPTITLWLDETFEGKGYTLSSFAKSSIKNKRSHIRGLDIEFSPMYLYHVLSIGTDYVTSQKSKRDNLTHTSSHKFDILLESVFKIQKNIEAVTYTIEEIIDMLGARENLEYKYLKKDILLPSIKDLEKNMGKIVTMTEIKEGKQVVAITFAVKMKERSELEEFLFHYIASQMFYFSDVVIKDLKKFANFLKNKQMDDEEYIGNKSFVEWQSEAEIALNNEKEILTLIEKDELFFKTNSLVYDRIKHTLLNETTKYENGEEFLVYTLIRKSSGGVISSPMESSRYILNLEQEYMRKSIHLIDLIPFAYSDSLTTKWIKVDSMNVLEEHKEKIMKDIILKNTEKFSFSEDMQKTMFELYVEKGMFNEITQNMKDRIQQVFNL